MMFKIAKLVDCALCLLLETMEAPTPSAGFDVFTYTGVATTT